MLETLSRGDPPDACLVDTYLGKERNRKREDYFLYEPLGDQQGSVARETMHVDACEVFTGPAGYLPANNSFERCLNNDRITQCNIPFFVWSGRSSGRTPVANYHSLRDPLRSTGNINLREERAMDTFRTISTELATLIKAVNDSFISDPIEVELFSAEGGNPPCALGVFRVRKECARSVHTVRTQCARSSLILCTSLYPINTRGCPPPAHGLHVPWPLRQDGLWQQGAQGYPPSPIVVQGQHRCRRAHKGLPCPLLCRSGSTPLSLRKLLGSF